MAETARERTPVGNQCSAGARERGQSHVIGAILLTGVVVLLVGTSGAIYLSSPETTSAPLFDGNVSITQDTLEVTHGGGDSIALEDLSVTLQTTGNDTQFGFEDGTVIGNDDGRFEPSETVRFTHDVAPGPVTILVVHAPSNTVLERTDSDFLTDSEG